MTYRIALKDVIHDVPSLKAASNLFVETRKRLGWTVRDTPSGIPIYKNGKRVAVVLYSGRVYANTDDWRNGIPPIYDPLPPAEHDAIMKAILDA